MSPNAGTMSMSHVMCQTVVSCATKKRQRGATDRPTAAMILSIGARSLIAALVLLVVGPHENEAEVLVTAFAPTTPSLVRTSHALRRASIPVSSSSSSSAGSDQSATKPKLSRAERKAKERAKKNNNPKSSATKKTSGNRKGRRPGGSGNNNNHNRAKEYRLHSTAISKLTASSTADDVVKAIKRAQNLHDVHDIKNIENFLLEECDETFAYGYRGSLLARLAVAAMHMNNNDLARKAIEVRRTVHRSSMLPLESAAIIRGLLRMHNVTDAIEVLNDELTLPMNGISPDTPESQELIKHRALSIASVASRSFFEDHPYMGVKAMRWLATLGPVVRESGLTIADLSMPWTRIIQGAAQCESKRRDGTLKSKCPVDDDGTEEDDDIELPCNLVFSVLDAMATFPSDNNDRTYEALSNALVRRTLFITGAVALSGCPEADRGEAAFIGRSNVGKSSLVNMITNRKSLAYTSKRPGKTQQFNFFAVNDKPEREREIKYGDEIKGEKDPDSFYIVDLPGFGYAKVPQQQRQEWSDFFNDYLANRRNLKILFHLVDARHGPIDEDSRIMKQVGETLPKNVKYVVVLTKADKNVKGPSTKNSGKVARGTLEIVRETMKANGVGNAPVLLTSSETKLGRDDLWRYLRLAAEAKVDVKKQ